MNGTNGKFSNGATYAIKPYKNGWSLSFNRGGKRFFGFVALEKYILEQLVATEEITGDHWDLASAYEISEVHPIIAASAVETF